jgi:hypothetical protein
MKLRLPSIFEQATNGQNQYREHPSEDKLTLDAEFWNTGRRALICGAENAGVMISR